MCNFQLTRPALSPPSHQGSSVGTYVGNKSSKGPKTYLHVDVQMLLPVDVCAGLNLFMADYLSSPFFENQQTSINLMYKVRTIRQNKENKKTLDLKSLCIYLAREVAHKQYAKYIRLPFCIYTSYCTYMKWRSVRTYVHSLQVNCIA